MDHKKERGDETSFFKGNFERDAAKGEESRYRTRGAERGGKGSSCKGRNRPIEGESCSLRRMRTRDQEKKDCPKVL